MNKETIQLIKEFESTSKQKSVNINTFEKIKNFCQSKTNR